MDYLPTGGDQTLGPTELEWHQGWWQWSAIKNIYLSQIQITQSLLPAREENVYSFGEGDVV